VVCDLRWLIDEIGAVAAVIAVNEVVVQVVGGELTFRALHRIMNLYSNKQTTTTIIIQLSLSQIT